MREQMEAHRANPVCASCHSRMDPIGFALENFDGVGKWRSRGSRRAHRCARHAARRHRVPRRRRADELLLTTYKDDFVRAATEKLLTYALGRGVEYYDCADRAAIARDAARDDYRFSSLILGVIKSTPFQMRRSRIMMLTNKTAGAPDVVAGCRAPRWRCRCSIRWCRRWRSPRRRAAGEVADSARLRLHAQRHHRLLGQEPAALHVDAEDRRRELRVQPDDEAARAVSRETSSCSADWRRSMAVRSATARAITRGRPRRSSPACIRTRPVARTSVWASRPIRSRRRRFGKHTQLASLELGLEQPPLAGNCDSGYTCAYMAMSWRSETSPLPAEINPRAVFERLFGDDESTDAASRRERLANQKSVLDYVAGSLARLQGRVGAGDRRKLDEYLDSVRDIERRIQVTGEDNVFTQLPHMERPSAVPDNYFDYAKLMMDLQVHRLADRHDARRVVHDGPRRQQSRLSRNRHLGRPPLRFRIIRATRSASRS